MWFFQTNFPMKAKSSSLQKKLSIFDGNYFFKQTHNHYCENRIDRHPYIAVQ